MKKAYLVLQNGRVFEGVRVGAPGDAIGELVFTTAMVGYVETLTDPSYAGQIVMQTFPLIGNYGIIPQDFEAPRSFVRGYVARELCEMPSNFRSQGTVEGFLLQQGIAAITGVDTREITGILREEGVMNAMIVDEVTEEARRAVGAYRIRDALREVSMTKRRVLPPEGEKRLRVALIDYGAKRHIGKELVRRGAEVLEFPFDASAEEILNAAPDGLMLSNGPGDPAENRFCIAQIEKLLGRLPIFGICLGHQMLALAAGAKTEKLKYGHRGANQPVKRLSDGRVFITSQNHGYAVKADTLPAGAIESYQNANDFTNEGVSYPALRAFSAQFHPEACGGPKDTGYLFDDFVRLMEEGK